MWSERGARVRYFYLSIIVSNLLSLQAFMLITAFVLSCVLLCAALFSEVCLSVDARLPVLFSDKGLPPVCQLAFCTWRCSQGAIPRVGHRSANVVSVPTPALST